MLWNDQAIKLDADEVKLRFDRDGYVLLPGFLSADELVEVEHQLARYVREVVPKLSPGEVYYEVKGRPETLKQMQNIIRHDDWFRGMFYASRFVKLAGLLLGTPVVGHAMEWFDKPAGVSSPTPPHQDGYYFMIEPKEALTMWLPLDVVGEDNGCVRYVRGSHRLGLRPHARTNVLGFSQGISDYSAADAGLEMPMHVGPGDLLVHHCLTIHRADANRSARSRRAFGFVYYSSYVKEDRQQSDEYQRTVREELIVKGKI